MAGGPGGSGAGVDSGSLLWAIAMSAFAAFGGILFGYDTGTIGGIIVMKDWLGLFGRYDPSIGQFLPTNDQSLVVSILSAGTFFGALLAYPMGDMVGRKWGIVSSCAVFSLGVGLQLDTRWATFVIGRVIAGFGVVRLIFLVLGLCIYILIMGKKGLVSCLVPMYQSECSPKNVRGFVVGLYQLAITVGALLAAIALNSTKDKDNHSSWRIPIAIQFAWAAILSIGMTLLPESPRFLLMKGRVESAKTSLGRLLRKPKDSPEVDAQYEEITAALEADRKLGAGTYIDCFRNTEAKNRLRTLTGMFLQAWQQLTGINFIFYYGTTFFKSAGIGNPFIITIVCDVVNTAMTIVGVQLIDRVGRRRLLIIGAVGMGICEFIIAIVGVTAGNIQSDGSVNLAAQRVLIAFVCIYISFFAISWGPVVWVVTGEIFPLRIRAKGMSLAVASNWLWNFGIGYATPYLVNKTTTGVNGIKAANLGVKVFFIWGSTCIGCLLFTYFFVPETKGLSLEEIDLVYRESSVLNSESYRKEILSKNETFSGREADRYQKDIGSENVEK